MGAFFNRWSWYLLVVGFVLIASTHMTDEAVSSLLNGAMAQPDTAVALVLREQGQALSTVANFLNRAALVSVAASVLAGIAALALRPSPSSAEALSDHLEQLLAGLSDIEARAATSRVELKRVASEQQKVRDLLELSAPQLQAIHGVLSPRARSSWWLAVVGLALGLVGLLWGFLSDVWSDNLPFL